MGASNWVLGTKLWAEKEVETRKGVFGIRKSVGGGGGGEQIRY